MRSRLFALGPRRPLSIARVVAITGTLVLHIVVIGQLWLHARVVPEQRLRTAITVQLYQPEAPPPVAPVESPPAPESAAAPTPGARQERPAPELASAQEDAPEEASLVEFVQSPLPGAGIDQQRAEIAAEIARESAPVRRAFRGRSIDAMLPDGDKGILPGFRPRTAVDPSRLMRKFGQMLSQGVPSAAVDPDAPMDLLTEGWEAKHHGSDLASCELKYEELDPDMRRKMCGEIGPGL